MRMKFGSANLIANIIFADIIYAVEKFVLFMSNQKEKLVNGQNT